MILLYTQELCGDYYSTRPTTYYFACWGCSLKPEYDRNARQGQHVFIVWFYLLLVVITLFINYQFIMLFTISLVRPIQVLVLTAVFKAFESCAEHYWPSSESIQLWYAAANMASVKESHHHHASLSGIYIAIFLRGDCHSTTLSPARLCSFSSQNCEGKITKL